jgi:hypothetical protein
MHHLFGSPACHCEEQDWANNMIDPTKALGNIAETILLTQLFAQ